MWILTSFQQVYCKRFLYTPEPSETPSRRSNVELPTKRRRTLRSRGKTNQNVIEETVIVDSSQVVEVEDRNNNQVEKVHVPDIVRHSLIASH